MERKTLLYCGIILNVTDIYSYTPYRSHKYLDWAASSSEFKPLTHLNSRWPRLWAQATYLRYRLRHPSITGNQSLRAPIDYSTRLHWAPNSSCQRTRMSTCQYHVHKSAHLAKGDNLPGTRSHLRITAKWQRIRAHPTHAFWTRKSNWPGPTGRQRCDWGFEALWAIEVHGRAATR